MHFWNSISIQMMNHEVGIQVSAINPALESMRKPRQSEENWMQLKQEENGREAAGTVSNGTVAAGSCAFR